ncbi:MAG: PKD domain-containing protein [Alistipes sp.]
MRRINCLLGVLLCIFGAQQAFGFARPEKEYRIFQFPRTAIPRIDGDFSDWDMVPDSYAIGLSELYDTHGGRGENLDPKEFDLTVKVGWVNGENRLYFYVEAYDDSWDFTDPGLRQDIFELVVDGDASGGPFIKEDNGNINKLPVADLHFKGHGAHAQNYHIFTPVQHGKDWAMVWGSTPWIKDFPYANVAYDYDFGPGESGVLKMEFWITPFDYAAVEGPGRSVVSQLTENELIGMSWCMIDFDVDRPKADPVMCLSHDFRMIRDASFLNAFRLMPLEDSLCPVIEADWSFEEIDRDRRLIRFEDRSRGKIEKRRWNFGDGTGADEPCPVHRYPKAGEWTVTLYVEGPDGSDRRIKVWEVVTK